mmetsp:Transcript_4453/g.13314  ORF Transcript_4453/g.13314 Transcript_4453/m.13314 type:complete len:247 (-) Transcript_4453:717-1457(-)
MLSKAQRRSEGHIVHVARLARLKGLAEGPGLSGGEVDAKRVLEDPSKGPRGNNLSAIPVVPAEGREDVGGRRSHEFRVLGGLAQELKVRLGQGRFVQIEGQVQGAKCQEVCIVAFVAPGGGECFGQGAEDSLREGTPGLFQTGQKLLLPDCSLAVWVLSGEDLATQGPSFLAEPDSKPPPVGRRDSLVAPASWSLVLSSSPRDIVCKGRIVHCVPVLAAHECLTEDADLVVAKGQPKSGHGSVQVS